jgi:hypothetical protein
VIPRNLAVTFAILCSLTLGMSLYLWQLRRREVASVSRSLGLQHVTPPAAGTTEKAIVVVAHDGTGDLQRQSILIPAFSDQQQRALEILRQLLGIYQQKDSPHPLTASAEIRNVYTVVPNTAVVDVNSAFVDGQTSGILAEELTLLSIVQTLSLNVPNLARVKLLVAGKERDSLAGHLDLSETYDVGELSQLAGQMTAQ